MTDVDKRGKMESAARELLGRHAWVWWSAPPGEDVPEMGLVGCDGGLYRLDEIDGDWLVLNSGIFPRSVHFDVILEIVAAKADEFVSDGS